MSMKTIREGRIARRGWDWAICRRRALDNLNRQSVVAFRNLSYNRTNLNPRLHRTCPGSRSHSLSPNLSLSSPYLNPTRSPSRTLPTESLQRHSKDSGGRRCRRTPPSEAPQRSDSGITYTRSHHPHSRCRRGTRQTLTHASRVPVTATTLRRRCLEVVVVVRGRRIVPTALVGRIAEVSISGAPERVS